jgi:hypothetical protein
VVHYPDRRYLVAAQGIRSFIPSFEDGWILRNSSTAKGGLIATQRSVHQMGISSHSFSRFGLGCDRGYPINRAGNQQTRPANYRVVSR